MLKNYLRQVIGFVFMYKCPTWQEKMLEIMDDKTSTRRASGNSRWNMNAGEAGDARTVIRENTTHALSVLASKMKCMTGRHP